MAKLYWRVKKNGKWTWIAAKVVDLSYHEGHGKFVKHALCIQEEE